jgi:uncharacterized protein (DUF1800 family)
MVRAASRSHRNRVLAAGLVLLGTLAACQREAPETALPPAASGGQVQPANGAAVSRYAAARFADQASFGPTPALIAAIQAKGFNAWIDEQFALPLLPFDAEPVRVVNNTDPVAGSRAAVYAETRWTGALVAAPDQLRRRISWALSQYIVVSTRKVDRYGILIYINLLQQHAFGNYGALLHAITTNPGMGEYLDNIQNRPTSDDCPACTPNENYARELMQLFSLGVVKLNLDGSVQRDARRLPVETYVQKDVEELARALTGWTYGVNAPGYDAVRYRDPLVPDSWEPAHDRGAKRVLGRDIGGGGNAAEDLDAVVALLMAHPNIAPFVSLRLIQHLVSSNPSPAYISRVATVFKNNGQGVAGDMKAVVKAILLDPEARRGDQVGSDSNGFGKMREPVLWYTGLLRGLGCSLPFLGTDNSTGSNYVHAPQSQQPFSPSSVFSFYAPTDRAPGSNLLAPEQRLLNASELSARFWGLGIRESAIVRAAGCDAAPFVTAFRQSPNAFADLVGERYFRGAMPVVLRQNLIALFSEVWGNDDHEKAMSLLLYALATPYYGAIL